MASNTDIELRIKDNNTKNTRCYPRYKIDFYCTDRVLNDNYIYNNLLLYSYNILSNKKYFSNEVKSGLDSYTFENISLYSPEEYEYNKSIYSSWTETFDEYKNNLLIEN